MSGGYRDEKETLRRRAADLEVELADARRELAALEPLRAERNALTERVAELAREAEATAAPPPSTSRWLGSWLVAAGAGSGFVFALGMTLLLPDEAGLVFGAVGLGVTMVLAFVLHPRHLSPPDPGLDPAERVADAKRQRAREKRKQRQRARVRVDTQREHVAVEAKEHRGRRRR